MARVKAWNWPGIGTKQTSDLPEEAINMPDPSGCIYLRTGPMTTSGLKPKQLFVFLQYG